MGELNFFQKSFAPPPVTGYMYCMTLLFAILCILALVAMICNLPAAEVSPVTPALALTRADALEATEGAIRAGDYARIRAAANRFGARVPRRTLNTAIHIARLAHDIAAEPRAALLAHVPGASFAEEAQRLSVHASAAREDLPGLLDRFTASPSSPILDEIVTEIVERYQ